VERAHNVIVLGPPGVGKTHPAIALGIKPVEAGYSVLFLTLEELIGRLVRAAKESRLERSLQQLTYPGLDHRRDWLPAALQLRGQPLLPAGHAAV
jgi:KaiC/GvpD/RAD55 family RecA-like ATPase